MFTKIGYVLTTSGLVLILCRFVTGMIPSRVAANPIWEVLCAIGILSLILGIAALYQTYRAVIRQPRGESDRNGL